MSTLGAELQALWRTKIPIAAAMGIEVADFSGDELVVQTALQPNVNLHGTAFAGSLYSVCALTGWGMTWLQLRAHDLDGSIVLADGRIEYRKAIAERIVCRCRYDAAPQAPNLGRLRNGRAGSFRLTCTIDTEGSRAVRFEGRYAVRPTNAEAQSRKSGRQR
jgi:thioesterase domain-containing protein